MESFQEMVERMARSKIRFRHEDFKNKRMAG
jgi:hypothetical protein